MSGINFTQDYQLYTPKKEGIYPLPESDWNRIKSLVQKIIPEKKIYNVIASFASGVFVSSIFSVITIYTISNPASWIIPTNWAIMISSLVICIALLLIDYQQNKIITISTSVIIDEMNSLECKYLKGEEGET